MSLETSEEKDLDEEIISCPVCGRDAVRRERSVETWLGVIKIISITCQHCGYRHVDEILVEPREYGPEEIIIHVRSQKDFRKYLFKSRSAFIELPQFGIEIFPGPDARDEITTVEGVIERFIFRLETLCRDTEDPLRCQEIVNKLKKKIDEEDPDLLIIIRDPTRFSRIIDIGSL